MHFFPNPEIPDFLTDEECEHVISLAKETGLSTSKVGRQLHEKDLDEIMKEAGRYWNLIEWLELVILLNKNKNKKKNTSDEHAIHYRQVEMKHD